MTGSIRQAKTDDIPILVDLIRQAFRPVADQFGLTASNCPKHPSNCEAFWLKESFEKGIRFYILESNQSACGCVALEDAGDKYYLERLAVLPALQGNGLGTQLVQHCFDIVRRSDKRRIEIGIIREQTDLYEWYLHKGFTVIRHAVFDHLPFEVTFMGIDLEKKKERNMNHDLICQQAGALLMEGYNCAESVATAINESLENPSPSLPAAASAFGGGIGSTRRELCGALSGACIAIGLVAGRIHNGSDDLTAKAMAADLHTAMLETYGTVQCQALVDQFGSEDRRAKCKELVEKMTRMMLDRLERVDEFKQK